MVHAVLAAALVPLGAFLLGCAATVFSTPLARRVALRTGILDAPGPRKLHREAVPYLGGVAVVGGLGAVWLVGGPWWSGLDLSPGAAPRATGLVLAALALMVVGLFDDLRGLSARARVAAGGVVAIGLVAWAGTPEVVGVGGLVFDGLPTWLLGALSVFWVLSLTNAANLMDGMDGLAAGVGSLACAILSFMAFTVFGEPRVALLLAVAAGSYAGFLAFNAAPARIFLGDAGSLPLGLLLGGGALYACTADGVLHAVPMFLVVGVPATDLLLSVLRRGLAAVAVERSGRSWAEYSFRLRHAPRFFEADRGHLHHRILERVGSIRATVGFLYLVGLGLGGLAVWVAWVPEIAAMILVGVTLLGFTTVAPFLHPELRVLENGLVLPLFHTPAISDRRLHLLYDVAVFSTAFVAAAWMSARWLPDSGADLLRVALVGAVGPLVMFRLGLYRIHFRNAGAWSFWNALSAAGAGVATALIVDTLAHPLLLGTAGAVLFLYLALTGFLLPRVAYTLVTAAYVRRPRSGRPALIQGVGRIETALAERALADPDLDLRPVGFLHDKPELGGRMVHGLPVVASTDLGVAGILRLHGARAVVAVAGETSPSRLAELREACDAAGADLLLYSEALTPVVTPGSEACDHDPASVARARSRARSA